MSNSGWLTDMLDRLTTPMGLRKADDISLLLLETRIDLWVAQLPATWPYSVRLTLDQAPSLLNVFIVAVEVGRSNSLPPYRRCWTGLTALIYIVHTATHIPLADGCDACAYHLQTLSGPVGGFVG